MSWQLKKLAKESIEHDIKHYKESEESKKAIDKLQTQVLIEEMMQLLYIHESVPFPYNLYLDTCLCIVFSVFIVQLLWSKRSQRLQNWGSAKKLLQFNSFNMH